MTKPVLAAIIGISVAVLAGVLVKYKKSQTVLPNSNDEATIDLPINVLPLAERPFITLAPDSSGRSLSLSVDQAPIAGEMEYELVYNSVEKQEGVFGRLELDSEPQPIVKNLLLGSKSGGGKVTYHEGVTGGSLTVTYGENKLKESWNFLTFDPIDPAVSSVDGRAIFTLPAKGLKKGDKIVTMKTFGYPKTGLPDGAKVVAGPYSYFVAGTIKGTTSVELKLPAGEHTNPTLYSWDGKTWGKLAAKINSDSLSSVVTGNVFLATAD